MTFKEYCTRSTGLGRTHWILAIIIHLGIVASFYFGTRILLEGDPWGWPVVGVPIIALVGFWWGTYSNYKTDSSRVSGNPHYSDVCEGCNPPCFNDGRPLTPIQTWYAAVHDISREKASQYLLATSASDYAAQEALYAKYLQHPQFK